MVQDAVRDSKCPPSSPRRQFGLLTALSVVYSYLASLVVLPSVLVVWSRFAPASARRPTPRRRRPTRYRGASKGVSE